MAGSITSFNDTGVLDLLTIVRDEGNQRKIVQEATKAKADLLPADPASEANVLVRLGDPETSGLSDMCCHHRSVSNIVERILIVAAATTLTLQNITVFNIPSGARIEHAYLTLVTRKIDNINEFTPNALNGATVPGVSQVIQIRPTGGAWTDAMKFVDDQFEVPAQVIPGYGHASPSYQYMSNVDIAGVGKVNDNGIYELRWLLSRATLNSLELRDAFFVLDIEFEV